MEHHAKHHTGEIHNGSFSASYDGVFDANFGLQYTTNGTTWLAASGWTFTPSYAYNSSSAANVTYTFYRSRFEPFWVCASSARCIRATSGNNSWFDRATEVQVYNVQV